MALYPTRGRDSGASRTPTHTGGMSVPSVPLAAVATESTDARIDELTSLLVRGGVMVLTGAGLSKE